MRHVRPKALDSDRAECMRGSGAGAFTLIELLMVITVIGIMVSLIFPGLRSAQNASAKARTRVQFTQWAQGVEAFRADYGYYPALHASHVVNPVAQNTDPSTLHLFHDVLAARRRDRSALPAYATSTNVLFPEVQNRRQVAFHTFREADFTSDNLLCDAFGGTEIAVLVDVDLDGVIRAGTDFVTLPAVRGFAPTAADFPAAGVKAGVVFYSATSTSTGANPEFVFSWK